MSQVEQKDKDTIICQMIREIHAARATGEDLGKELHTFCVGLTLLSERLRDGYIARRDDDPTTAEVRADFKTRLDGLKEELGRILPLLDSFAAQSKPVVECRDKIAEIEGTPVSGHPSAFSRLFLRARRLAWTPD